MHTNISTLTTNSSATFLNLPINQNDLFNSSNPGYFDAPPPPGGPGAPFSPLFNQPIFNLVPAATIDLSFLKNLTLPNLVTDLANWTFSKFPWIFDKNSFFSKHGIFDLAENSSSKFEKLHGGPLVHNRYFVYGASQSSVPQTETIEGSWEDIIAKMCSAEQLTDPSVAFSDPYIDLQRLNPNNVDENGDTLFICLIEKNMMEHFKFFLQKPDIDLTRPMQYLVTKSNFPFFSKIVKEIQDNRQLYKKVLKTVQRIAKQEEQKQFTLVTETLLNRIGAGDFFERTPQEIFEDAFELIYKNKYILRDGRLDFLNFFLTPGVNLEEPFISIGFEKVPPLIAAIQSEPLEIVQALVSAGASVNKPQNAKYLTSPLSAVINRAGNHENRVFMSNPSRLVSIEPDKAIDILTFLLSSGLSVNTAMPPSQNHQSSPLGLAIENAAPIKFLKALIEAGANLESENRNGKNSYTPLLEAISSYKGGDDYSTQVINLLIDKGVNLNHVVQRATSPLSWAIFNGFWKLVDLFIEKGADVNLETPKGGGGHTPTPLHSAVWWNQRNNCGTYIVKALVAAGANIHARVNGGKTAREMAESVAGIPDDAFIKNS